MAHPFWLAKLLVRTGLCAGCPPCDVFWMAAPTICATTATRSWPPPVDGLQNVSSFLEARGAAAIDLALGAPRFDLVPSGSTKLPADRRGWPPLAGLPELRAAAAENLLSSKSIAVRPADEVLITQGAAGAFAIAADAFLDPGDAVVVFDPTSPLFNLTLRSRARASAG